MYIEKIKQDVNANMGKSVKIIYNGSRNKKEVFVGKITEVYDYLFIVVLDNGYRKCFSFNDVLIGTVVIKY